MKLTLLFLLSIVFATVHYVDEALPEVEEMSVGASETEILDEELLDDDAAWILEEEKLLGQVPTGEDDEVSYTKLSKKHCARQKMEGYPYANTLDEAKNMCANEPGCGGVYDSDCNDEGRYYLCRADFVPSGSRASCVYKKEISAPQPQPEPQPEPEPATYTKVSKKHCSRQKLITAGKAPRTLKQAQALCDAENNCGGIYDAGCDGKGTYFLCQKGFTPDRSRSSCIYLKDGANPGPIKPQPTDKPQPKPQPTDKPIPLDACLEKGSCEKSVAKCGHCLYNSQCEDGMYCCPYMKKCVIHGGTPCFSPVATCIPPCSENSPGYPHSCKCKNDKFPNEWYNTPSSGGPSIELAVADIKEMPELTTSDELEVGTQAQNVKYVRHEHGGTISKMSQYFIVFMFGIAVGGVYKLICNKLNPPRTDEFESLLVEEI